MFNPIDYLISDKHHLVMNEVDVMKVLKVINAQHKNVPDMKVGNCGWADDKTKWFIHFTTTRAKWDKIVSELKVVRLWNTTSIPKNTVGVVYSTD